MRGVPPPWAGVGQPKKHRVFKKLKKLTLHLSQIASTSSRCNHFDLVQGQYEVL